MKKADTTRKYVTTKKYNKLVDEIERLQEQLQEANEVIKTTNSVSGNIDLIQLVYEDRRKIDGITMQTEGYLENWDVSQNKYNQVRYDLNKAYDCGIKEHPQKQMKNLGYKVIAAVAQSLYDCWWFTVEDYIEPFPPYIEKMEYDFDYWHGDGEMIVT